MTSNPSGPKHHLQIPAPALSVLSAGAGKHMLLGMKVSKQTVTLVMPSGVTQCRSPVLPALWETEPLTEIKEVALSCVDSEGGVCQAHILSLAITLTVAKLWTSLLQRGPSSLLHLLL